MDEKGIFKKQTALLFEKPGLWRRSGDSGEATGEEESRLVHKNFFIMKLLFYIFVIAAIVLIGWFWIFKGGFPSNDSVVIEKIDSTLPENISDLFETSPLDNEPSVDSVNSVDIDVAFTSQAPYEIWDPIHEDACEEASIIMANVWAKDIPSLSREYAEDEIQKLVKWQNNNFGYFESTTAKQTAEMAQKFYGLDSRLIENPSVEDIKNELREGNVIVMGMAGRELGNPHFTAPGPLYHMLLIKGFDKTGFITNDPGTKYGGDYNYPFSTLMSSASDWSGKKIGTITKPPVAIVFSK